MARRTVPRPITSVLIQTPAPAPRSDPDGDVRRPWPWQKEAIDKLKTSDRRMLTAPTGSGKSLIVESLGLHDLANGRKVIVAVPQLSIGQGYERETIEVDRERMEWNPAVRVDAARTRRIVRFLVEPPAESASARTLVCTHLALVMAAQHPDVRSAPGAWKDVSLFLDEAHHSLAVGDPAGPRTHPRFLQNSLGRIVNRYLRADSGPLTLVTATWMRTDAGAIVPEAAIEAFSRYHRTFDEHMMDMRHIRTLEIRFVVGAATECLATLFREHHPSTLKTVVWHPAPGSHLLREQGGKHGALARYRTATGWRSRREGGWDTHDLGGRFTALELIDDGPNRTAAMSRLLAGIDAQKRAAREQRDVTGVAHRTPDVVWALNLLREGSDYPALARGILMAPRGAMLDTLQMMGRLLRDYPGKERVEFNIVLPTNGRATAPTAQRVSTYLQYMMASLLVEWQFAGLFGAAMTLSVAERDELSVLERADVQQQLAKDIVDAAIRTADAGLTPEDEADRIADRVLEQGRETSSLSPHASGLVRKRLRQMLLGRATVKGEAGGFNVEQTIVGRLRAFVGKFGYDDLRRLREELGCATPLTIAQVHAALRDFHTTHGRWPTLKSPGHVPGIGGTWLSIQVALAQGGRGLPGGSSLLKERNVLTGAKPGEALTKDKVVDAILEFRRQYGTWPNALTERKRKIRGLGHSWSTFRSFQFSKMKKEGRIPGSWFPARLVHEAKEQWRLANAELVCGA